MTFSFVTLVVQLLTLLFYVGIILLIVNVFRKFKQYEQRIATLEQIVRDHQK